MVWGGNGIYILTVNDCINITQNTIHHLNVSMLRSDIIPAKYYKKHEVIFSE